MSVERVQIGPHTLYRGDCRGVLPTLCQDGFDSCVCDPPYGLGFMGKEWDKPGAFVERKPAKRNRFDHVGGNHNPVDGFDRARTQRVEGQKYQQWCQEWATALLRVLKPGAYALIFGGTRTYHRLACAVEDAGFEIRDCINWLYGSGFPKGKGCLKPAWESILLCRKPGPKVLPLGIDECRVPTEEADLGEMQGRSGRRAPNNVLGQLGNGKSWEPTSAGRWPANVVHDGSNEVLEAFAAFGEKKAGVAVGRNASAGQVYGNGNGLVSQPKGDDCLGYGDTGTAARFFYCAKASKADRGDGNNHPTVKPHELMRWLVRLVTPPDGLVLDPFAGSASTGKAAHVEGRRFVGVEREPKYFDIACKRLEAVIAETPLFAEAK